MLYVITDIIDHGSAVKEFHIGRQDGGPLPEWLPGSLPGSHIVLHFSARDGRTFDRHYSLIGMAGPASSYRIAVQREEQGKGGSLCLHEEFPVGSVISVSGPFNSFALDQATSSIPAPRILLIAGGIGITPIVSMAHALNARGTSFELHYLVRNTGRLILMDELLALPHATVSTYLSQQSGRAGLAQLLGRYGAGDSCYACGPAALLHELADVAARLGWPAHAIHSESFGARAQHDDVALTVELSLSQMTLQVPPGMSILDALIANDVFVSYDCQRGECGNCYTTVLAGQPVHRDMCLTPAMREQGMCPVFPGQQHRDGCCWNCKTVVFQSLVGSSHC